MRRVIDLSVPIEDHFRWPVARSLAADPAEGSLFQVTKLGFAVHGFTHMDSPRHFFPDGPTTSDIPLETTVGEAAVVDLTPIAPNQPVDAALLAARGDHILAGDIVVMRSGWGQQRSLQDPAFWAEAPYVERDAAEWLLARGPRAVAFDFPQDFSIRQLIEGDVRPIEEHVTHHVLLRNGVILIEYLTNTMALTRPRTFLCCLPLKLPDSDGAPARVVALEDD